MRRILFIIVLLLAVTAAAVFFWQRGRVQAAVGPAVALCPGPDLYGYTCDKGRAFAYIDAAESTGLEALDGLVTLDLPFPFTFYGTTYEQVQALTNGNLQFNNGNVDYQNLCLDEGAAPTMGDMIAVYWTDLDLRFGGALETAVVGEPPNRIFVIEWDDVPRFESPGDDSLTFAVQLFETTNDIVFFYADVMTEQVAQGAQATIGLQSAAQGIALQYSCNSRAVSDGTSLQFVHPEQPNPDVGQTVGTQTEAVPGPSAAREPVATVMSQLAQLGPSSLPRQRARWLQQTPARALDWRWANVLGNGRDQLILLVQAHNLPQLTEIAVLDTDANQATHLRYDLFPAGPDEPLNELTIAGVADLTADARADVVFHDPASGRVFVLTSHTGNLAWLTVPGRCSGGLGVLDADGDGRVEIVRDGCDVPGRVIYAWRGRGFLPRP